MTTLPNNITRYTGANTFSAQDFHGNIFYVLQKQNDTGSVVMELPDGSAYEVLSMPAGSGRPCLEVNPLVGLWAVGNKETSTRTTPPRYPIAQYVPFPAVAGGITLFDAPYVSSEWSGRALAGGALVDIPATFGVPSAPAYLVRLSGLASAAGVIVRAGTERAPYFVTLVTQVANIRVDTNGWIPGPMALISTVGGSAACWLQIVGASG
jgi:hypothetical protein